MYSVQCTVYSVQCAVYSVQCTVNSVQCIAYSVQCTVYSVKCTVYSVQCAICKVMCAICKIHYAVCSVQTWALARLGEWRASLAASISLGINIRASVYCLGKCFTTQVSVYFLVIVSCLMCMV